MSETLNGVQERFARVPKAMEHGCEWTSLRVSKKRSISCELMNLNTLKLPLPERQYGTNIMHRERVLRYGAEVIRNLWMIWMR